MVTTQDENEEPVGLTESVANAVRDTSVRIRRVSGATPEVPFRLLVLFVVIGITLALGPMPWAGIGVAALALLAIDVGARRGR